MSEISGIPPPDTSPSSAIPIPIPTPPSIITPPPGSNKPSLAIIKSWAPLYLHKTDALIARLNKILSTPSGTDTLLSFLGYSSLLSSSLLSSLSLHQLQSLINKAKAFALKLPPGTTVVLDVSDLSIRSSRALVISSRLKALSGLISDFRIFARLWGLLGLWRWGKSVLLRIKNGEQGKEGKKGVETTIEAAQVLVNIAYQYLENGAYLSQKGVLGWSKEKQGRAWVWSSRFWGAHVGLDFLRLGIQWNARRARQIGEKGEAVQEEEEAWRRKWRKEMLVNMAYAPLTIHWGLEKGLVGETTVGLLGSVAGAAGLREVWRSTRS